jgi:sRNA-binding protein
MNKPVLLAVGIRKEMSKETGVSSVVLKRWIAWYCRKSNYYANHIQGTIRFHLDGSEAGIVTEKHQEKMENRLEKIKVRKTTPPTTPLEEKSTDSDDSLSDPTINDI